MSEKPRQGVLRPLCLRVQEQEEEAPGRRTSGRREKRSWPLLQPLQRCHCYAGRDGTGFHPASSCPKAANFKAFIQQRAQLVEQIKSVENIKDRATTASAAAGTDGKYSMCPSDTSVPFTFARNHATQSSLLPTRKVMDEGEKPVISCEFMDFTAYMATSEQPLVPKWK
jgi:hypothetical protein